MAFFTMVRAEFSATDELNVLTTSIVNAPSMMKQLSAPVAFIVQSPLE
jgi:hypothetical protein